VVFTSRNNDSQILLDNNILIVPSSFLYHNIIIITDPLCEMVENKPLEQTLERTYWRADQVVPRIISISEGVLKELAEGLSDEV
jgi:hypothetical protein